MLWFAPSTPGRFLWEHWNDESIVYDAVSGQTHLLNALAVETLVLLQSRPMELRELADELSLLCGAASADALTQQVSELAQQLWDLGLLERNDHAP